MPHLAGKKQMTERPFYHHYHPMENGRNELSPPENTDKISGAVDFTSRLRGSFKSIRTSRTGSGVYA